MRRSRWNYQRARQSVRSSFSPAVEFLEERLAPDVSLPTGFANFTLVNTGLLSPTALETLPDGRVFVALQNGTVRVVQNDTLLAQPLIALSNVDSAGERGLLGITYDPGFAMNRFIYVYYTANAAADPGRPFSHNRLSRLTVTGNTAGNEEVLWRLPSIGTAIWHMGGGIHFGPDGMIYLSVGDHQTPPAAQSLTSPFGKILRLDVSGATAVIPTNNPFYGTATGDNRAIWALGLRNAYTTAFQPGATGRFYLNDVGEGSWEEINPGAAARNFGWPATEGRFNPGTYPNFTNPLFAYPHSGPGTAAGCAIAGGDFYNPQVTVFPGPYVGKYFFQDFCRGWMRTLDPATNQVSDFATGLSFPTDLRVSPSGAIYYLTRGQPTGGQPSTGGIGKIIYPANQLPLITNQPASQTVAVTEPATFTVSVSSPTAVSYQWQRNGTDIGGATSASYTLNATSMADHNARFRVIATNAAGSVTSNDAVLTVIDSARPTGTITAPAAGSTYRGGVTINFAGTGTDPENGTLPASAFTWQVDFHHDEHVHPFMAPTSGITSGSFVVPTNAHPEGILYFRIYLTVRDSVGLTHTTFRDILPERARVTLNASHAGLRLNVNGQPQTVPYSVNSVINTDLPLEAPAVQTVSGTTYQFASWSNGGSAAQVLRVPAADTTLTATYRAAAITFVSDLTPSAPPINGWGPMERDMSNGETAAGDGRPITLNGTVYPKGLGVHARSEVTYALGGAFSWFLADVGVDDEVGANGSVVFQVLADGVLLFDSGVLTGSSATRSALVNVAGRNQLRLIVTNGGDGDGSDHADWADARLVRDPSRPSFRVTGFPSPTRIGSQHTFVVTAQDANGDPLTGYQGTVRFTSSDPRAQLPANYTFTAADQGTRTFTATLNSLGLHALHVADIATSMGGSQSLIQVLPSMALTSLRRSAAVLTQGGTLTVSGAFVDLAAGQTHQAIITWGDGSPNTTVPLAAGVFTFSADHPYTQAGNFEIRVTLMAADGAGDTIVLPASATAVAPPTGLASWWAGDGGNAVTAPDIAGTNPGTLNGGVTYAAGRVGNALSFDGAVGSFVNIANAASLNSTTATWSFWMRSTQTSDYVGLVGKHDAAVSYNGVTMQMHQGLPRIEVKANGPTLLLNGTTRLNDGQFHHMALSFQSGGTVSLYVDGQLQATGTAPAFAFGATPLRFGKMLDGFWTSLNGLLDEVQIVNRVLSAAEIQAVVSAGAAGQLKGVRVLEAPRIARFTVAGFLSPTTAGQVGTFQVRALDQFDNVFTAYRGTVRFSSDDARASLPADYTFVAGDNGVRTFSATLRTAGARSLTATDTAAGTIVGSQNNIQVTPAAVTRLLVSGFPTRTDAGALHTFQVAARDAFGNVNPTYRGTVHLTSSAALAFLEDDYTFTAADQGVHTFSAILYSAGLHGFTARDVNAGTIFGYQKGITVRPLAATQFFLVAPETVRPGDPFSVVVLALDPYFNLASDPKRLYIGTVRFTSSDGQASLPADYTFRPEDGSVRVFDAILRTTGSQTITATDIDDATITGRATILVSAGGGPGSGGAPGSGGGGAFVPPLSADPRFMAGPDATGVETRSRAWAALGAESMRGRGMAGSRPDVWDWVDGGFADETGVDDLVRARVGHLLGR